MSEYHRYVYTGPVLLFDSCITGNWKAETMAVSKEKALSNLKHQYKKKTTIGS